MAEIDTTEIDFDRVNSLLNVVHLATGVGPKLTAIAGAAMTELAKINDAIKVASSKAPPPVDPIDPEGDPSAPDPDKKLESKLTRSIRKV